MAGESNAIAHPTVSTNIGQSHRPLAQLPLQLQLQLQVQMQARALALVVVLLVLVVVLVVVVLAVALALTQEQPNRSTFPHTTTRSGERYARGVLPKWPSQP
jgi:lipopolysaccharide/colanic/teichoic acid biosynthesis glycosyltransferase